MTVLVIAPHSDDEVLGCGGTIAKHARNGDEVHVCVVTSGSAETYSEKFLAQRDAEIDRAADILDVAAVHRLDHTATELSQLDQSVLNSDLADCIETVGPDVIYIPHRGDLHLDHRVTYEAALVAARPHEADISRILSYETLSETEWGEGLDTFDPSVYIDISEELDTKVEAMEAYETAIQPPPHPRSSEGVRTLASKRGMEVCVPAAEAFELVRELRL